MATLKKGRRNRYYYTVERPKTVNILPLKGRKNRYFTVNVIDRVIPTEYFIKPLKTLILTMSNEHDEKLISVI